MIRLFKRAVFGLAMMVVWVAPAPAFDGREAETVVGIMERYVQDSGAAIYHGGAGELFEYDADNTGLIAAAGFDFDSWTVAHDAVMTGYMASIPQAAFDAILDEPMVQLASNTSLSEEQKAVIREDLAPELAAARDARASGQGYAAIVQPLLPRLEALVEGRLAQ
jgi:hypothetical protein